MNRIIVEVIAAGLILGSLAVGQNTPGKKSQSPAAQPANELAEAMAQRLSSDLHVKTVVGEPVKVGSVTLIPIMMIDVSFGGGGVAAPGNSTAATPQSPAMGADGFFMNGEARPLGFVAISKKGTRFISVGKTPAK
ncbi:MAG: hypothetical protein ABSE35_00150 [Bryobacteraceae bacterium]